MKPAALVRSLPGHPLHPPFVTATPDTYTFARVALPERSEKEKEEEA